MSQFRVRPMVDPLMKEQQDIEKRRQRDAARKPRILHARTRLYGVDTQALAQQVAEKQERERLDIERDLYYDDLGSTFSRALNEQEAVRHNYKKQRESELKQYRDAQVRERIRREAAERTAGEDMLHVPTNFLKFGGEDENKTYRTRAQKLQQQDWLSQQIETLQAREARDRQEQADYDRMTGTINDLQAKQQAQADLERARARREVIEYTKQMAANRAAKMAQERELNQRMDDMELTNALADGMLNEAPGATSTDFKGFTTEQRQRILDEVKAQQDDARARRAQEDYEEQLYAQQQEDIRRARMMGDRAKLAREKAARLNVAADQKKQAQEKTLRYDYLDNVVYTNAVEPHYFEQFGTSCR